jgi:predicted dehydrogenase
MIAVGIIGAGGIARSHAKAIANMAGRARLYAVADSDESRAREFAGVFSAPKAYGDYRELLSDREVDMVTICTPNALHSGMAVEALAAGKAVLCEKPIAGSLTELDAIAAAQEKYGGVINSVYQWRYGEGLAAFRGLLEQGIPGRILWAQANVLWRRIAEYYASGPWRGSWKGERGGPLLTLASHAIDALLSVMGEPRTVFSVVANFLHDVEVEDASASTVRFSDGSMASINVTSANQTDTSRLHFICERMSALSSDTPYNTSRLPWTFLSADRPTMDRIEQTAGAVPAGTEADLIEVQVRDFIEHLERGKSAPVTVAEARKSIQLITAIYKSGFTGKLVDLPIQPEDPFYAAMNGGITLSPRWSGHA